MISVQSEAESLSLHSCSCDIITAAILGLNTKHNTGLLHICTCAAQILLCDGETLADISCLWPVGQDTQPSICVP